MKKFKQLVEELTTRQKLAVNSWVPYGNIKAINLSKHVIPEHTDHIIIPLHSKVKDDISNHLEQHGYKLHDYVKGTAIDNHNREVKIGKVLEKTNATDELKQKFINDDRASTLHNDKHEILISRNPYHVAEGSTDKKWKSCATLSPTCTRMKDAAAKMPDEVREGTHVAYLIKKGTFNPNEGLQKKNVVGRIYLKPHEEYFPSGTHRVLIPENKIHSNSTSKLTDFQDTVNSWTNKHFSMKDGSLYRKNPKVYDGDSTSSQLKFNTSDESIEKLKNSGNWSSVVEKVAKSIDSPHRLHNLIDKAHEEKDEDFLTHVTGNPHLNSSHVDRLLSYNNRKIDRNLAYSNKLQSHHIDHILDKHDPNSNMNLANNHKASLSSKHIHTIIDQAQYESPNVQSYKYYKNESLEALVQTHRLQPDHINKLVKSDNTHMLTRMMQSPILSNVPSKQHVIDIAKKYKDSDLNLSKYYHPYHVAIDTLRHHYNTTDEELQQHKLI